MSNRIRVERQIGKGLIRIETGVLAKQAAGCCTVQYGETVTLSAVASGPPRAGLDYFPLTCDYRERHAAAGKFPGGFLKREGRPTTKETLTSRLIDRPIRPMFPDGYNDEVQILNFVLASDRQTDGDVLAMNGACAALGISPLPFQGPLGAVRLGLVDGQFVPFPTHDELEVSELDLIVSGNREAILMIEGFARELPEDRMAAALDEAHKYVRELCDLQDELIEQGWPAEDGLRAAAQRRCARAPTTWLLRQAQGGQANGRQAGPRRSCRRRKRPGAAGYYPRTIGRWVPAIGVVPKGMARPWRSASCAT